MNTADHVLFLLKTGGVQTAQQLAEKLLLTSMGVRRHLEAASKAGFVGSEDRADKVGRPARYWRLTDSGHARFPDRHSTLTVELISSVREVFGQSGLDKLINAREVQCEAQYEAKIGRKKKLSERVAKLALARDEEGYMAKVKVQSDGSFLLIEDHCPICAAAAECQNFCRSELAVFQRVLGSDCTVNRVEHLLTGARRCVYEIKLIDR
ncbi:MAG: transcriptional regulator [Rhodocyclaceae bacterium]|nr:transcriptional regulator [Rhodocyclaceae bacterium]MBP6108593.1 transcriptional regulator [Rhodocyclaceae bacterium]MBP6278423.1 transcriptional regulator [Rhodocyclaceae bacterium]